MIVVIGSSNTDMVIKCEHLPAPGETILGGNFFMNAGGKGANQAVAAARLNGDVSFIAKVGNDVFGRQAIDLFIKENIRTEYIFIDDANPSGVALITVDAKGENCIAVAQGANGNLSVDDIKSAEAVLQDADIILVQLEIPIETIEYIATFANQHHKKLILNPAPACILSDDLLSKISVITPNETEASMLSGIDIKDMETAKQAAKVLSAKGIETVIITLGKDGALLYQSNEFNLIPTNKVNAVDTTAAGDVFNGALAVALSEQKNIKDAVRFANMAASVSVTRLGAQASAPYRSEPGLEVFKD
ncbi:MAG TPA: ribokinase [Parafilimonas sp.]|nr:ribokinase [Parafilimonas sp.]